MISPVIAVVGWLGFVVVPMALLVILGRDVLAARWERTFSVMAETQIRTAREALTFDRSAEAAEHRVSELRDLVAKHKPSWPFVWFVQQFMGAARQAMYAESHDLESPEAVPYLDAVADCLEDAEVAMQQGDTTALADVVGRLYVLDAIDKGEAEPDPESAPPPNWVKEAAQEPLKLAGIALEKAARMLESENTLAAKDLLNHARTGLPLLCEPDDLALPLLVLNWAGTYLHYAYDNHVPRSWLVFRRPEQVAPRLLARVGQAAVSGDERLLVTLMIWSDDAYSTSRI
jgi:hypothetical protein